MMHQRAQQFDDDAYEFKVTHIICLTYYMQAIEDLQELIDSIKSKVSDDEYLRLCNLSLVISKHVLSESALKMARDICDHCGRRGELCECNADLLFNRLMDLKPKLDDMRTTIAELTVRSVMSHLY